MNRAENNKTYIDMVEVINILFDIKLLHQTKHQLFLNLTQGEVMFTIWELATCGFIYFKTDCRGRVEIGIELWNIIKCDCFASVKRQMKSSRY